VVNVTPFEDIWLILGVWISDPKQPISEYPISSTIIRMILGLSDGIGTILFYFEDSTFSIEGNITIHNQQDKGRRQEFAHGLFTVPYIGID
jgi:hypothetical protein